MSDNMDMPLFNPNRREVDRDAERPMTPHPDYPGLMMKDSPAAVVGLPYPNPDGSSRMEVAHRLLDGQLLVMVREPHNPYDENAVAVYEALVKSWPDDVDWMPNGQVGYLPKGLATLYAPIMDEGAMVFGTLHSKQEKTPGRYSTIKVLTGILQRIEDGHSTGNELSPSLSLDSEESCKHLKTTDAAGALFCDDCGAGLCV